MVRAEGLEPPRLSAPEPKSGASTNSATPAQALVDSRAKGLVQLLAFAPCKLGGKPKQYLTAQNRAGFFLNIRQIELTTRSASRLRHMRQQSGLIMTIHIFKFRAFRRNRIHLMPQLQVQIALKDLRHFQKGVEDF